MHAAGARRVNAEGKGHASSSVVGSEVTPMAAAASRREVQSKVGRRWSRKSLS